MRSEYRRKREAMSVTPTERTLNINVTLQCGISAAHCAARELIEPELIVNVGYATPIRPALWSPSVDVLAFDKAGGDGAPFLIKRSC